MPSLGLSLTLALPALRCCPWCNATPAFSASPADAPEPWAKIECSNAECRVTAGIIAYAETAETARVAAELAWNSRVA